MNSFDRVYLSSLIKDGIIATTPCNIPVFLKNSKVLLKSERKSASATVIVLGDLQYLARSDITREELEHLKSNKVAAKISFATNPNQDNSLHIEILVYKHIINNLLARGVTPHLISYIMDAECSNFFEHDGQEEDPKFIKMYNELYKIANAKPERFDKSKIEILVTEYSSGIKLSEFIKTHFKDDNFVDDMSIIIFQVLYTIEAFNKIGLRHNDIHLSNIFVENLPEKKKFTYILNDKTTVTIETHIFVKVYDFDFSTFNHYPTFLVNGKLSDKFCNRSGICNEVNAKYDVFRFLSTLYDKLESIPGVHSDAIISSVPDIIKFWITKQIDLDFLKSFYKARNKFRLCKLKPKNDNFVCEGNYVASDTEIKPVSEILNNFKCFKYIQYIEGNTENTKNAIYSITNSNINATLADIMDSIGEDIESPFQPSISSSSSPPSSSPTPPDPFV